MHWEWVVPVIALVLWILNNLIRNASEDKTRPGQRPPQPDGQRPAERPASDVDQLLEEIDRMRRRSAPQRREEARPQPTPPPQAYRAEEPRRVEQPRPVVAPTVAERPRPERPRTRTAQRPAEKPRTMVAKQVVPRPGAEILDVIPVASPVPAKTVAASVRRPETSSAVLQLRSMLRTPSSVQAAIMLHEVLGPPRCRRR